MGLKLKLITKPEESTQRLQAAVGEALRVLVPVSGSRLIHSVPGRTLSARDRTALTHLLTFHVVVFLLVGSCH